jgi:SHS2 domain-containing protein
MLSDPDAAAAAANAILESDSSEGAFGGRLLGAILGGGYNHETTYASTDSAMDDSSGLAEAAADAMVDSDSPEGEFGGLILGSIFGGVFNHEEPRFVSQDSTSGSEMATAAMEAFGDNESTEGGLGGRVLAAILGGQFHIEPNSLSEDVLDSGVSAFAAAAVLDLSGEDSVMDSLGSSETTSDSIHRHDSAMEAVAAFENSDPDNFTTVKPISNVASDDSATAAAGAFTDSDSDFDPSANAAVAAFSDSDSNSEGNIISALTTMASIQASDTSSDVVNAAVNAMADLLSDFEDIHQASEAAAVWDGDVDCLSSASDLDMAAIANDALMDSDSSQRISQRRTEESDSNDSDVSASAAAAAFNDSDNDSDIEDLPVRQQPILGPFTPVFFSHLPTSWIHPDGDEEMDD